MATWFTTVAAFSEFSRIAYFGAIDAQLLDIAVVRRHDCARCGDDGGADAKADA